MNQFNHKWTIDRQKFLSEPEINRLRQTVEDKAITDLQKGRTTWPRFWMAIDLALNAGLRVSEITGLKIENIYLSSQESRLRVTGKRNRIRDIFISKYLTKHILDYLEWKIVVGETIVPDSHLLLSSHNRPYSTRTIQYAFKKSLEIADLPSYYSIHACRHSYGTYLYQKTKNLRMVQKQLGHSSITTTTVYADVSVQETLGAVNKLYDS